MADVTRNIFPKPNPIKQIVVGDVVMCLRGALRGIVGIVTESHGMRLRVKWDNGKETGAYRTELLLNPRSNC